MYWTVMYYDEEHDYWKFKGFVQAANYQQAEKKMYQWKNDTDFQCRIKLCYQGFQRSILEKM